MSILLAILKISGILSKMIVDGSSAWYQFVVKNWTFALLVGIGITFTGLNASFMRLPLNTLSS
ncbi:2-hydroxycarboxylate transporter family protein [Oceanobacillus damuensis]|uniref:2-hydroxycarboxylate transporter family protein n=1 Tax=Oceanobacillus damuensis TaxID=937928 RepID=UPI00082EB046|nr:2-hydroxycarboxylate transporter family protein [Oceanobacillus damuensis]